jgi:DNA-binding MarR family transcriptional regulator
VHDEDVRRFRQQMKLLQRRLRREVPPVPGLSRSALQVLMAIARADGATPGELGDELGMTSSNVAAALRELEAAALVSRARDPEDRRRVNVSTTAKGGGLVADRRQERDTWLGRAIVTQLSAEEFEVLRQAGELMERLAGFELDA